MRAMVNPIKVALLAVLLSPVVAAAQAIDANKILYDEHRWPELRDAIKGKDAPALYFGAVASAYNDTKSAEKYFHLAIKQAPTSDAADEAHGQLAYLYARLGRNREVVQQFDRMNEIKPGRPDIANARGLFAGFSHYPDSLIGKKRYKKVRGEAVSEDGLTIPISINGKAVRWGIDSGANISVVAESEARMLGLTIDEQKSTLSDLAGGTTLMRTTVINRLTIGEVELRNVPFMVIPDSQPPWDSLPPGERGFLGFTALIPLQSLGWTSDGTFEIGFSSGPTDSEHENLWFDGLSPKVRCCFKVRYWTLFSTLEMVGVQGCGAASRWTLVPC